MIRLYVLRNKAILFSLVALMFNPFHSSKAQVLSQDSLALVDLYNNTDGANWIKKTNWLTTNVSGWYGVAIYGNRVSQILLPANNLNGKIAVSFAQLDSLKKVKINDNKIASFPSISNLTVIDTLDIRNNQLTFKDIKSNIGVSAKFLFVPQDSVDRLIDTIVVEQNTIALSTTIDTASGVNDRFQWFKDGDTIVGATARGYTILCMDSSKAGLYTVQITNPAVSGLTLSRRTISLVFKRLANAGNDLSVCSGSSTLNGILSVGVTKGTWTVISGGATVANDTLVNSTLTGLSVGNNVFKWTVSVNGLCPASSDFVTIVRDAIPSLANAGLDKSVCRDSVFLAAASPIVGTGGWTVTKGSGIIAQPSLYNSSVSNLSTGENIFRWQVSNGVCPPSAFDEVKVFKDDTIAFANAGIDSSLCITTYTLSAQLAVNTFGIWTLVSGGGIIIDSSAKITPVSELTEGANVFRWTVSNTCNIISDDVTVTVYPFTKANAGADKELYYSPLVAYPLADQTPVGSGGNGTYSYFWNPSSNLDYASQEHPAFLTPDIGTYTFDVLVTDGHGCLGRDTVVYTIVKSAVLVVPTLFTPNGDGLNDALFIPGIESYPNNELTVVDRNGQVVYKKSGYTNDWQGTHDEGFNGNGKTLSADTYYYTLKLEDKNIQKGFFLIKK